MARGRRGLSAAQQALALHAAFPQATLRLKAGQLVWVGELQPTSLSRTYRVQITYRQGDIVRVRVLDHLEARSGEQLPHTYGDDTLCLYKPGEWQNWMSIADTTIPWTSEWLANYEIWLATGTWHGGGEWLPRPTLVVKPVDE